MANKRDFYEVLGVNKSATKDEIKSAYRKLARTYHPDNKTTGDAKKFEEVQEAYDILYDDQKRSTYDQFGHAAFDQNAGGGAGGFGGFGGGSGFDGFGDIGDLFNSFFGGGRRSQRSNPNGPRRGEDTLSRCEISFMDSIKGKKESFPLTYEQGCPTCGGTGAKNSSCIKTCQTCGGSGVVRQRQQTPFGIFENQAACPDCRGTGRIITEYCSTCGGKGYNRTKTEIEINIPAGISSGQQIRIPGKGGRGANGGENGDLFLEVIVKPHEYFTRQGNDIHIEVPIDMVQAALGTTIVVPTVYGDIEIEVKEGTQPGTILKARGKGVKDIRNSNLQGDEFIHLAVKTPTKMTKEQKDLLRQFSGITPKNETIFEKFISKFKK
ncbi:MAG: molecular chaperone DnaJ [Bacilli bacterium]|nr:molecular chaperone DnaJ [Bacilli bacterium]